MAELTVELKDVVARCFNDQSEKEEQIYALLGDLDLKPLPLLSVVEKIGVEDAVVLLTEIEGFDREKRLFGFFCAEQALPIFEAPRPSSNRLRVILNMAKKEAANPGAYTQKELAEAKKSVRAIVDKLWNDRKPDGSAERSAAMSVLKALESVDPFHGNDSVRAYLNADDAVRMQPSMEQCVSLTSFQDAVKNEITSLCRLEGKYANEAGRKQEPATPEKGGEEQEKAEFSGQLTTTLNSLPNYFSFWEEERSKNLLVSLGKTTPDDTPLPLSKVLETYGLPVALFALRAVHGHEKERLLFGCTAVASQMKILEHNHPEWKSLRKALYIVFDDTIGHADDSDRKMAFAIASDAVRRSDASIKKDEPAFDIALAVQILTNPYFSISDRVTSALEYVYKSFEDDRFSQFLDNPDAPMDHFNEFLTKEFAALCRLESTYGEASRFNQEEEKTEEVDSKEEVQPEAPKPFPVIPKESIAVPQAGPAYPVLPKSEVKPVSGQEAQTPTKKGLER
jgi:hypothetical protein